MSQLTTNETNVILILLLLSQLRIDTGLKLHVNSFNVKNSHWEPLVEMFEFYLNVKSVIFLESYP
jgi:hypothetical protein